MDSREIRRKFLDFFEKRGHTVVPSASLMPDDPSVLLTTAGMQQFKPYYGKLDPETTIHPSIGKPVGKNAVSIQKSFRTSDIDEVGDESHLTFFEMLGNFSFGGPSTTDTPSLRASYFKKDAIKYAHEFITKEMGLTIDYVTVFDPARVPEGDWRKEVPFDEESYGIWKNEIGLPEEKIRREGVDNFWGPTGNEGPCGPTTEIYIRGVEIWNIVFNEYYLHPTSDISHPTLEKLKTPGVDTGMGLERLAMVSQGVPTIFETDLFSPIFEKIKENTPSLEERAQRVVADHIRGSVFLIADGITPSNTDRGYVLRRLIRRITHPDKSQVIIVETVINNYQDFYQELKNKKDSILTEIKKEEDRFRETLYAGLKQYEKGKDAFTLYTTYGFPLEFTKDLAKKTGREIDEKDFQEKFKKHQEISRAGQEKKFGGHGLLLDTGELKAADEKELKIVTRLHTSTHLLQAALRAVLGDGVKQMGSDITAERTRFDFTFERKLTPEEIKKVEDWVNDVIQKDLVVQYKEMSYEEAKKTGALHFFKEKYPEKVKVYFVGESLEKAVSKEFCGGPHVTHTGEIGKFRIAKEEAVGAGIRRIRGIVE